MWFLCLFAGYYILNSKVNDLNHYLLNFTINIPNKSMNDS